MNPKRFCSDEIPYEQMWDGDKIWLPHILKGEKIEADFIFNTDEKIEKHNIQTLIN